VSSVGKEVMTHPFKHSPQGHAVSEKNAMYQKVGEMFGTNGVEREAVSKSQKSQNVELERDTNAMHRSATAKSGAYVGPEVRKAQRSARESRDDVSAMHQKAASTMFSTGARDEAVRRDEAGAHAVFAAHAGLKVEASTDVMYQRADTAYAASTSHLDELRTSHCCLLSKAW